MLCIAEIETLKHTSGGKKYVSLLLVLASKT